MRISLRYDCRQKTCKKRLPNLFYTTIIFKFYSKRQVKPDYMNGITIHDGEHFEKALRRFSKVCERAGILSDIKKYRHFEKPSDEKKRKMNASRRKRIRDEKRYTYR